MRKGAILIILFGMLISIGLGQLNEAAHTGSQNPAQLDLPEQVPPGEYTPFGYLDNPAHSMVFNRSGVIRSLPPLGFGFWNRQFFGSYGEGPRGHLNYLSLLQMSMTVDGQTFFESRDFSDKGVDLYSAYHTRNMMSYDWKYQGVEFTLQYFLPRENSLLCRVEIWNPTENEKAVTLHATHIYGDWEIKWWGSNGLSSQYLPEFDATVSKIWAYGDVFILASDWQSNAHKSAGSREQWADWIKQNNPESQPSVIAKGPGPMYSVHSYRLTVSPGSRLSGVIYLCRDKNQAWALEELRKVKSEWRSLLQQKLAEDEVFWATCPQITGEWPVKWKHGWLYDWETLRMNIRPPLGIFKHPWDAMQIHSPRLVLGETSLDMLTFSYADPELAKEVIYGTFADALAPNIPCCREDGSVNMIGADGSECGTAPMWGFPFHVIQTIFTHTADTVWIGQLYPYLKAYLEWWLQNRTDSEGWLHCNNSWESGQDGSRRFLVEGEGDPATFVRTVDVEASMAEAMQIMQKFAGITGQSVDIPYWQEQASKRIGNTRSMFVDGWFRDIDGRSGQPIIFDDFYDPIMLAPLTCNIASTEKIQSIRPKFRFFVENPQWLQWPPAVQAFTEAAWVASEPMAAALGIAGIADRVYSRTDSRKVMFTSAEDPFSYRIPGVANEFWPLRDRPAGGENYGWGAILPAFIIRNIIGFRENIDSEKASFYLIPAIPESLWRNGGSLGIQNLHYRQLTLAVDYQMRDNKNLVINIRGKLPDGLGLTFLSWDGKILQKNKNPEKPIKIKSRNGIPISVYVESLQKDQ